MAHEMAATVRGISDLSRKGITIIALTCVAIVAMWYGYAYWSRYQKEYGWAVLPKNPLPISNSATVKSLSVNDVSLLNNSMPLVWSSGDRHECRGEVEGDPQRWLNSLYPRYTVPDDLPPGAPRKYLQLRYRFWREGGTRYENAFVQGLFNLNRKDSTLFVATGVIRVPRRPGEYEFQIWAGERDHKAPERMFDREFGSDDHLVGRRHISVRPAKPAKN